MRMYLSSCRLFAAEYFYDAAVLLTFALAQHERRQ